MIAAPAPAFQVLLAELGRRPRSAALPAKSIGSSPTAGISGGSSAEAAAWARARRESTKPPMRRSSDFR